MSAAVRETGRRYPANVSEFARRLYEDGRTIGQVVEALANHGHTPARSTVIYWCDPEYRAAHNLKNRLRLYPAGRQVRRDQAWWVKLRRMRELREAGLSFTAIAAVMTLDFDLELDHERVRRILNETISKGTMRRLLS